MRYVHIHLTRLRPLCTHFARVLIAVVALLALTTVLFPATPVAAAAPVPAPSTSVTVPVHTDGRVSAGLYSTEWSISSDFDALAAASGVRVTFGGTFHNIFEDDGTNASWSNTREILDEVWKGKATPFVNVGIDASASRIASGVYDAKIYEWATNVKQYLNLGEGRSVIIAPLQEMNYGPTPWGCNPSSYRTSYRKFVDTFRALGIDETQVRWAFAPNNWTSPGCGSIADYYPGDDYVDVIGISAYNWGTCLGSSWQSPSAVFGPAFNEIRTTVSASKPFIVAQTAAPRAHCGGYQDQWVRDAFDFVANDPNAAGLVYFNFNKETDWRVWIKPTATPGWRDAVQSPPSTYEWPLSWFRPGTLTVSSEAVPTCPGPVDDVTVLGGPTAVSNTVLFSLTSSFSGEPSRMYGSDRFSTAAAIADEVFTDPVSSVFIATGYNYPDALSAGAAAANAGAPLLLVSSTELPAATRAALTRFSPQHIYVAGGPAVVSDEVFAELTVYSDDVVRLAGANRFSTAAAVAASQFPDGAETVYLATGRGFPDALSAGAAAAVSNGVVLLSEPDRLPAETAASIRALSPDSVVLVGGNAVLSPEVESAVVALGVPIVRRIAGSNRYATSAAVSRDVFPAHPEGVLLATGVSFPDALAGVAAAGHLQVPLLLTDPSRVPSEIETELHRLFD